MDDIWTKSNFKVDELDRKTLEIWIPVCGGETLMTCELLAKSRLEDEFISVSVLAEFQDETGVKIQKRGYFPQSLVDRIEIHPNQNVAAFRLRN